VKTWTHLPEKPLSKKTKELAARARCPNNDPFAHEPTYSDFFHKSAYYDINSLNHVVDKQNLFLLHFNVRSTGIQKNVDKLATFLTEVTALPDAIAISETKLKPKQHSINIDIPGYNFIRCDSSKNSGGFYLKENIDYKVINENKIGLDFVEDLWVEIQSTTGPVMLSVIYRHPTNIAKDYEDLSAKLYDIFYELNSRKQNFYALGDYNIDLMNIKTNNSIRTHVNNIMSLPCKCAIDLPTRITDHSKTIIDHIYIGNNSANYSYKSGVIISDLSDHYGTFVSVPIKKLKLKRPNTYA